MIPGRHPGRLDLAAWFDGEGRDEITTHVADCRHCRTRVAELRRVRATVRGEPIGPRAPLIRRVPVPLLMVPAAVIALVVALLPGSPAPTTTVVGGGIDQVDVGRVETASPFFPPTTGAATGRPRATAAVAPSRPAGGSTTTAAGDGDGDTSIADSADNSFSDLGPLRIGLVIPKSGPLADEGRDTLRAVTQAVAAANAAGGARGHAVELETAPAENADAVATLVAHVEVLVGGFGLTEAPRGATWLMPADPTIEGVGVIAAEPVPQRAGNLLGADVVRRKGTTLVGVVAEGTLADQQFIQGLILGGMKADTERSTDDDSCIDELSLLRDREVPALALAGTTDLVLRCINASVRMGWRPPSGIVTPPSTAYRRANQTKPVDGARAVFGLPWPTSDAPGAVRFRAAVPRVTSYRALVSFAAAELAIGMVREGLAVTADEVRATEWRNDMVSLRDGVNVTTTILVARKGNWVPVT